MRLPNFTIAGFAKCGTTSLYHYLWEHPDIFLSKRKELHYYTYETILKRRDNGPKDREMHRFHTRTFEEYKEQFAGVKEERAIGDVSPTYALYDEGLAHMKEGLGEGVKVILVVRDPIKRAYSNYLHLLREGRETLPFYEALQEEDKRRDLGYSNFWYYKFISSYYGHVQRVKNQFKDVLVVTFEDFVHDPQSGIKEIYRFLGVDDSFVPKSINEQFNPGGVYKRNVITNFIFGRSKLNSLIKSVIPLNSTVRKIAHGITSRFKTTTPSIDAKSEEYLINFFKDDVRKLREEFGVKTAYWNKAFN